MLYVLGGAPRAGKSIIAGKFLEKAGIPYFSLDILMMGFAKGLPEYGLDPDDDELRVAEQLWPVVKAMATTLVEDGIAYLIEGVQLDPRHVSELVARFPASIRTCFLGFAEADPLAKFHQIRRFGGGSDDWTLGYDDQTLFEEVERFIELSTRLRAGCRKYGLTYFEVSTDLRETVDAVVQYLIDGSISP